jgi:hypothetical protein
MNCPICDGYSSPDMGSKIYCHTCRGRGATCDNCGSPALNDFPDPGLCLCLKCALARLDHKYNQALVWLWYLVVFTVIGIAITSITK